EGDAIKKGDDPNDRLRVAMVPSAINPAHWIHLLMGLLSEVDVALLCGTGADTRKPQDKLPQTMKYRFELADMITRKMLAPFVRFCDFGNLSEADLELLGDEGTPGKTVKYADPTKKADDQKKPRDTIDGEDYIFKMFAKPENRNKYLTIYYYIGLDHQHFTDKYDTYGKLRDNIKRFTEKGIFQPKYHKIVMVIVDRPGEAKYQQIPDSLEGYDDVREFLSIDTKPAPVILKAENSISATNIRKAIYGENKINFVLMPFQAYK
ncbi:unnamed protein product, partial [marine sediment metagenome]